MLMALGMRDLVIMGGMRNLRNFIWIQLNFLTGMTMAMVTIVNTVLETHGLMISFDFDRYLLIIPNELFRVPVLVVRAKCGGIIGGVIDGISWVVFF